MNKRLISLMLCLVMALSMFAGCSSKEEATTATTAAPAGEATTAAPTTEAPAEPTNLVIPSASCISNLNPLLETMKEGVLMLNPMYDPLYVIDVNETRYYLAESYEVSEDGMEITVKLRDGMKWHDGEAITADDMIFTMDVIADTNNGAAGANIVFLNDTVVGYEKIDDLTVKITLPSASASYTDLLGALTIIPEHVFGGNTNIVGVDANMKGVGSGAYKLKEFVQDQHLVVEKFDEYFLGEAQVDTITFKIISDLSAQEIALANGEINFLELANSMAVAKYSSDANYNVVQYPEGRVNFLAANAFCPTFEDPRVLEAVFAAISKEEIIAGAYGEGMAVPANGILGNVTTFYNKDFKGYEQDIEKAKALVAEAGLDKKPMKLYFNSERVYMKETAQIIQQQLKNVGITLEVTPIESAGFFEKVFGTDADYEFYLNGYGQIGDPDKTVYGMFNGTWGCNLKTTDELTALWTEARSTFDTAKRQELYDKIEQLTKDEYVAYPIAYPNYVFVTTADVEGTDTITRTPVFEDFTQLSIAK